MVIHREVRSHINKTAHAAGLIAEHQARKRLMAEAERLREAGKRPDEIIESLRALRDKE